MITTWNLSSGTTCGDPNQVLVLKGLCCVLRTMFGGAFRGFRRNLQAAQANFSRTFRKYEALPSAPGFFYASKLRDSRSAGQPGPEFIARRRTPQQTHAFAELLCPSGFATTIDCRKRGWP